MRMRVTLCCAVLLWSTVGQEEAQARSTLAARFASQAIAGPAIEQEVSLYLHYFPGDGEAILRAEIAGDPALVEVKTVRSGKGAVQAIAPVVQIDYTGKPIGRDQVDTLLVSLVAKAAPAQILWQGRIYSSADTAGRPAHAAAFALQVQPPLQLQVEIGPRQVFPDEQARLEVVVRSADSRGIEGIAWEWPPGLAVAQEQARTHWSSPLQAGEEAVLEWQARIAPQAPGALVVRGRAWSGLLAGSPVPEVSLQVLPAPVAQVRVAGADFLEAGKPGRLVCEWRNPGEEALELAELQVEIPSAFSKVRLVNTPPGTAVEHQQGVLLLKEVGSLAPGASLSLELEATPLRPGPFPWHSSFRPAQRPGFIPAAGQAVVRVAQPQAARRPSASGQRYPTDLELMSQAFGEAVERELRDLPLPPGAEVYLEPYEKSDKNWVIDDALLAALLRQGYRITLKPPAAPSEVAALRYRLVDARVVCAPAGRGLNPFGAQQRREAYGDLLMRLETADRAIRWMRRVQAYLADQVPADQVESLGASSLVKRTRIEAQHKMVEGGLSASIIGGLFYIFFVP